jgi:hypothetical protein
MLLTRRMCCLSAAVATAAAATAATATAEAAAAGRGPADTLKTVAAVDRAVAARLEGNLGRLATVAANHVEELALDARAAAEAALAATTAFPLIASQGATGAATLRFTEATRCVELLVVRAECELLSAVRARQRLVCEWHFSKAS